MYNDIYIKVIEYAIKRDTIFKLGELFDDLSLNEKQRKIISNEVRYKNILATDSSGNVFDRTPRDVKVWCSTEDRFRVLEYYELKEARQSAKEARCVATIAILISALSLLVAIIVSISPTEHSC